MNVEIFKEKDAIEGQKKIMLDLIRVLKKTSYDFLESHELTKNDLPLFIATMQSASIGYACNIIDDIYKGSKESNFSREKLIKVIVQSEEVFNFYINQIKEKYKIKTCLCKDCLNCRSTKVN